MAGIAAYFGDDAEAVVRRILDGLSCRTTGDRTVATGQGFAIAGLGAMPVGSASSMAVIDGVVLNYAQLAEEMRAEGHKLASKEPAELVCALYKDFGPDGGRLLDGELAVILAGSQGEPYLYRDRYSGTPLFYGVTPSGGLAAASERVAVEAVASEVRELPAATFYSRITGEIRYFEPPRGSAYITDEAAALALAGYHLREAVERRLAGGKRVAVISDGGTASKLVAAYAAEFGAEVEIFAAAGSWAAGEDVATALGLSIARVDIGDTSPESIAPCATTRGEPDQILSLAALGRAAVKNGHTIVLTTVGSDELFGVETIKSAEDPLETHELLREAAAARTGGIFESADSAGAASGVQLRLVFADPNVAMAAWELSPLLKYRDGRPGWPLERLLARAISGAKVPTT